MPEFKRPPGAEPEPDPDPEPGLAGEQLEGVRERLLADLGQLPGGAGGTGTGVAREMLSDTMGRPLEFLTPVTGEIPFPYDWLIMIWLGWLSIMLIRLGLSQSGGRGRKRRRRPDDGYDDYDEDGWLEIESDLRVQRSATRHRRGGWFGDGDGGGGDGGGGGD